MVEAGSKRHPRVRAGRLAQKLYQCSRSGRDDSFRSFWKRIMQRFATAAGEICRSLSKPILRAPRYARAEHPADDLTPAPSGVHVRVLPLNGNVEDDF